MVTYIFPGQGSQSKGMGGPLFDEFKEITAVADQILGYSIRELCTVDPDSRLGLTQYTQPAIYVVNALCYLHKIEATGKKPDFVAGHSLGEYSALFAAEAFDFTTGLKIVKKRGELMGRMTGGSMAAVIGLDEAQIATVLKENHLDTIDIANLNSPYQIVISGPKQDIERSMAIFEAIKAVKMVTLLKTSGAFHSRYMETVRREFEAYLDSLEFSELKIPVISNLQARPYRQTELKRNLAEQISHPVRWTESIRYLMSLGEMDFEEIGNGRVLTGLVQRIRKEAEPLKIETDPNRLQFHNGTVHQQLPVLSSESAPDPAPTWQAKSQKSIQNSVKILPGSLGSSEFKKDYNLKYAYLTGGMYRGIASKELVVKMGKAGMMGFFGTGGLTIAEIETAIRFIQGELNHGEAYGINLSYDPNDPDKELQIVELLLRYGIRHLEAAAYITVSPALVRYRLNGIAREKDQNMIRIPNKLMAKVSRPEVAAAFMAPPPPRITTSLLAEGKITETEFELAQKIPMVDDLCVEADSGGHTDQGVAYTLMPAMLKLRAEMMQKYGYQKTIRVGAAGGIGTPEAAAAAFILGADFILTGSINQCTVEADTHPKVKDLLQQINVQDTAYAPAGDLFELGAKVQVLKKGVFFPVRANKLLELYRRYNAIDEIDATTRQQLEEKYFHRSFAAVYEDVKRYYPLKMIEKAENNPKFKMALIFKWYFGYATQLALSGDDQHQVDYQIPCGPALGAFNQWVKGTPLENWRNRHVDEIGLMIMNETANLLNQRYAAIVNG